MRRAKDNEWMEVGRSLQQDYQKNQRVFWQRVRLSTRSSQKMGRVCDEDGHIIGDPEEAWKRWKRHFEGLLGSEGEEARRESASTNECGGETGRSEEQECISIEEVREAIKKLKNGRTPEICGIHAEMLKAGGGEPWQNGCTK